MTSAVGCKTVKRVLIVVKYMSCKAKYFWESFLEFAVALCVDFATVTRSSDSSLRSIACRFVDVTWYVAWRVVDVFGHQQSLLHTNLSFSTYDHYHLANVFFRGKSTVLDWMQLRCTILGSRLVLLQWSCFCSTLSWGQRIFQCTEVGNVAQMVSDDVRVLSCCAGVRVCSIWTDYLYWRWWKTFSRLLRIQLAHRIELPLPLELGILFRDYQFISRGWDVSVDGEKKGSRSRFVRTDLESGSLYILNVLGPSEDEVRNSG